MFQVRGEVGTDGAEQSARAERKGRKREHNAGRLSRAAHPSLDPTEVTFLHHELVIDSAKYSESPTPTLRGSVLA